MVHRCASGEGWSPLFHYLIYYLTLSVVLDNAKKSSETVSLLQQYRLEKASSMYDEQSKYVDAEPFNLIVTNSRRAYSLVWSPLYLF